MQLTIGQVMDRINAMRTIVREIESGGSVEHRIDEIAEFLDEYIIVLSNVKLSI